MNRLVSITRKGAIPITYSDSPMGILLEYHNLIRSLNDVASAHLLISMCIDNRKQLRLPKNFAYIIRTAGANLIRENKRKKCAIYQLVHHLQFIREIGLALEWLEHNG